MCNVYPKELEAALVFSVWEEEAPDAASVSLHVMACIMFLPRMVAVFHFFRAVKRLGLSGIVAFWRVFAHVFAVVFVRHVLSLLLFISMSAMPAAYSVYNLPAV